MSTTTIGDELTGDYTVDASHSHFGFAARHAMVTKVKGAFRELSGQGHFDAADPARSTLELTISVDSIDTGNADRDAHLRTNDFFDLEHFPEIRFVSTAIEPSGESVFSVTGDLTIRGVTRPLTIDVEYTGAAEDPFGNHRIGLEGSVTVNRKDWGLDWNVPLGAGGVLVSEKVTIEFDVSAVKNEPS